MKKEQYISNPESYLSNDFKEGIQIVYKGDFPDPSVIKENGMYYAVGTNTFRDGQFMRIQGLKSHDGLNWREIKNGLITSLPSWVGGDYCITDFWAPFMIKNKDNQFLLYYSFGTNKGEFGISVAVSNRPDGNFKDLTDKPIIIGSPELQSTYIDPFVEYNGKDMEMYWGSNRSPIKKCRLTSDGMKFAPGSVPQDVIFPYESSPFTNEYGEVLEGVYIYKFKGVRYLFASGKDCFANEYKNEEGIINKKQYSRFGNYAIIYAIENEVTHKFEWPLNENGKLDNVLLEGNLDIKNPGNNCILSFIDSEDNECLEGYCAAIKRDDRYRLDPTYSGFVNKRMMIRFVIEQLEDKRLRVKNGLMPEEQRFHIGNFDNKQPIPPSRIRNSADEVNNALLEWNFLKRENEFKNRYIRH